MIQAVGLYDHWIGVQGNYLDYADQWSQHTVQSIVWSAAGAALVIVLFFALMLT
jgi:hypothetical protein